uniref:Uncharacterized protein n=1 Tax=Vitis vinifera TaxID=29760 RepID=F6H852_VITVI
MLNSLCKFVPSIREQMQDWEDGLCESDADGSFLHENWNKDLRLFSDGEDGGQQLFQLFILRAESELQTISGDNLANNLQCIDSLKAQVSCLFGGHIIKPMLVTPGVRQCQQSRDEIFKPRRVGSCTLADVRYKGDWMKRPISDDEVAWLAKLLVRLSDWLNENLGLSPGENNHLTSTWSYVEVSGDVCGPIETMKMVWCSIGSWLLMWGVAVAGLMRKYGLRVNLRMLASKKVVMVLLLSALFSVLKRVFCFHSKVMNKGAWTSEEDRKLAEYIEVHGAKRWKTVAFKSGLNRCGKSCRLRWLNYLRPNIKRGNISDDEEDLILRLHKLLGNRWSLIAGRLPGRTDNEIKNYWNSHLSKKLQQKENKTETSTAKETAPQKPEDIAEGSGEEDKGSGYPDINFDVNEFFDFSAEGSCGLEWVNKFLELDEESWLAKKR